MDINSFATQTSQTTDKTALSGSKTNILGSTGMAFWNTILGNLTAEPTAVKTSNDDLGEKTTPEKLKSEKADLALLQLALLGQDPDKNLEEKLSELRLERLILNKENRTEQLTKLISHLTNGLPVSTNEDGTIEALVARLEKRLDKLEANLEGFRTGDFGEEGAPFQLLIATGLNPNQLTKITTRIEEVEAKLGRELTVEDLIAGVGNIIPLPMDKDHKLSTSDYLNLLINKTSIGQDLAAAPGSKNKAQQPTGEQPVGAQQRSTKNNFVGVQQALNTQPINTPLTNVQTATTNAGDGSTLRAALPEAMSNAEFKALFNGKPQIKVNTPPNAIAATKSGVANTTQTMTAPTPTVTGQFVLPAGWSDTLSIQNILSEALGFDIQTGTPFNTTMMAAHSTAAGQHAGQSHPATQMVAAQITKAAQSGDTSKMTLRLDPPELGRVDVKLEFGNDKSVKALLVVEKPETLLMLQRDAGALERALQNAGLDTDSGSLNYEMAGDDYAFDMGKDGNNKNGSSGNGSNANNGEAGEDEDLITTTMTWNVDPDTGHVHYNILA